MSPTLIRRLRHLLDEAAVDYRLEVSRTLEESNSLVMQAASQGFDTLWMGGGDGTINVLLNQSIPANLTLGVVPMGTVNALARALGIPINPEEAVKFLLKAQPRAMNVGCVNGERLFLCFAGVGFDAAVVHDVGGAFKRVGGRLAYLAAGVASVFALRRIVPFDLELTGKDVSQERKKFLGREGSTGSTYSREEFGPISDRGYSFVLSNIRNYAGFNLFPDAHPCAEAMEMWLFRHRRVDAMAAWSALCLLGWNRGRMYLRGNVGHYLVTGFTVKSRQPMYLQLDGEAVRMGDGTRYEVVYQQAAVKVLAGDE